MLSGVVAVPSLDGAVVVVLLLGVVDVALESGCASCVFFFGHWLDEAVIEFEDDEFEKDDDHCGLLQSFLDWFG